MSLPRAAAPEPEGVEDWTHQLNSVEVQLEQLVEAICQRPDTLGNSAQACLDSFRHLLATAPIQLKTHAHTEQALSDARRALEKAYSDLAESSSLSYQIDMIKIKR